MERTQALESCLDFNLVLLFVISTWLKNFELLQNITYILGLYENPVR